MKDSPVTVVWLRPATGVGKEISLLIEDRESVILESLHELDESSRCIAEEELEKNYIIPRIFKITRTDVHLGNRYFEAETDRGKSRFVVKNPFVNIRETVGDGVMIRDVVGNLFTIRSLSELDAGSLRELEKVR